MPTPEEIAAAAEAAKKAAEGGKPVDDANTDFKKHYNEGFNAALKFFEQYAKPGQLTPEQLQAEIQKLAAEKKKPTYTKQDDDALEKLKNLELENQNLKAEYARSIVRGSLSSELSQAGAIDVEDALLGIESRFEIRKVDGKDLIFRKGATIPETVNGKEATVKDFVLKYKAEKPHLFRQGGAGLETDISAGAGDFNVTDDQLRDPNFVKALKGTGQYDQIFEKKPVDLKRVRAYMETMR